MLSQIKAKFWDSGRGWFTSAGITLILFLISSIWNIPSTIQTFLWWTVRVQPALQWIFSGSVILLIVIGFWRTRRHRDPLVIFFDMSAHEAFECIKTELSMSLDQANQWVTQMFKEGRIQIRAVKRGQTVDAPLPKTAFDTIDQIYRVELHLMGTQNDRQSRQYFGTAYHDDGWICYTPTKAMEDSTLYISPRFISAEIRRVSEEYKQSRPAAPDLPFADAIDHLSRHVTEFQGKNDYEIQKAIVKSAFYGKLTIWANKGQPMLDRLVPIPPEFFYNVEGGPYENSGFMLESFGWLKGWSEAGQYKRIYNVTLNRLQLEAAFSLMQ